MAMSRTVRIAPGARLDEPGAPAEALTFSANGNMACHAAATGFLTRAGSGQASNGKLSDDALLYNVDEAPDEPRPVTGVGEPATAAAGETDWRARKTSREVASQLPGYDLAPARSNAHGRVGCPRSRRDTVAVPRASLALILPTSSWFPRAGSTGSPRQASCSPLRPVARSTRPGMPGSRSAWASDPTSRRSPRRAGRSGRGRCRASMR